MTNQSVNTFVLTVIDAAFCDTIKYNFVSCVHAHTKINQSNKKYPTSVVQISKKSVFGQII